MEEGNRNVLQEYLEGKQQRLKEAANNPDEYIMIDENEFEGFIKTKYDTTVQALDPLTRDLAKIKYLIWEQEKNFIKPNSNNIAKTN